MIGLDFGTSSTKATIQAPYYRGGGRVAMVEWFPHQQGLRRYLLPTTVHRSAAGDLALEPGPGAVPLSDLKLRILAARGGKRAPRGQTPADSAESEALVIGYLALALRRCWDWFDGTERPLHRGAEPRWQLNLGIPSAGYDDAAMRASYQRMLSAAWWLAESREAVTVDRCTSAREDAASVGFSPGIPADALSIVAEVAAEVVGYAKSNLRSTGLHLLVDVGASTLDICGFVLHDRHGEDRYAFLTADVLELGAFRLHQNRLKHLNDIGIPESALEDGVRGATPLDPVPLSASDYVRQGLSGAWSSRVLEVDRRHVEQCRRALVRTIIDIRKRRDPNSPRWREGLPVFLVGGGSRHPLYREALRYAGASLAGSIDMKGLLPKVLPRPANLINGGLADGDFPFLAVAYGLGHERLSVGEIQPPSEIEDIKRTVREPRGNAYIGKEQV